ncbi:hypothetical protein TNCV_4148601 [Trichonephila clavipes]|nr:hypothetical protein TNCV_4148601 [Trichonephila clavipes]
MALSGYLPQINLGVQVFPAHVPQLQIFEQHDPHLSQVESHKQDSSDVPIKSIRSYINREIGVIKGLVHPAQFIAPQCGIQVTAHINCKVGLHPIIPKPYTVMNDDWNILQKFR